MCDVGKLFKLIDSIVNRDYLKDNWLSLLDSLSRLFGVDGAFIGLWDNNYISFKYSSSITKQKPYLKSRISIKERDGFLKKLIENGYIKIERYDEHPLAVDEWKEMGLKSLLVVLIKNTGGSAGSLHLVSFKEYVNFTKEQIDVLQTVAHAIGSELYKEGMEKQLKEEREITAKYISLIKTISESRNHENIEAWIERILKDLKEFTGSHAVSLIFPSENIYMTLNHGLKKLSYEEFKDSLLYRLWVENITEKMECVKESLLKRCVQPELSKAVAIPVTSNGKTIAIVCFGFKNKQNGLNDTQIDFMLVFLRHFISLIYTQQSIREISSQLSKTEEGLLRSFVSSVEVKDVYTRGHSEHVAIYAKAIAKKLHFNENEQEMFYNAGLLHDIGKIGIPDSILLKPGKLTPHEYEIMKLHPLFSFEIVKNIPKFSEVARCIKEHHERIDGSGYPDGLKGDQIKIGARILAIADVFDALTTTRPYRETLKPEEAIETMKHEALDTNIIEKTSDVLLETYRQVALMDTTSSFVPEELETIRLDLIERDPMTGLYSRPTLIKRMNSYIRENRPFHLFMVDICNISYINYKYSTEVGDKLIVIVSEALKRLNRIKHLTRTNADAFMFIYEGGVPGVFKDIIQKDVRNYIAERLVQKSCVIDNRETQKVARCYITHASFPEEAKTPEELIYKCILKKKLMVCDEIVSYKENG